jgi:thioredoxin-like negative regulator of GroEL
MVPERLLLLALAAMALVVSVWLARAWAARRTARLKALPGDTLLRALNATPDGRPSVVVFSSPSCAACHTAQEPAVEAARQRLGAGRLRVHNVDVARQPEVARAFGVMTVPSSVVLDEGGRVSAINHGFAPSQQLLRQLKRA